MRNRVQSYIGKKKANRQTKQTHTHTNSKMNCHDHKTVSVAITPPWMTATHSTCSHCQTADSHGEGTATVLWLRGTMICRSRAAHTPQKTVVVVYRKVNNPEPRRLHLTPSPKIMKIVRRTKFCSMPGQERRAQTHFMSWAWGYKLLELQSALHMYCHSSPLALGSLAHKDEMSRIRLITTHRSPAQNMNPLCKSVLIMVLQLLLGLGKDRT